jgi:hypothetical protein
MLENIEKGKLWTPENGGCEGINHKDAPIVAVKIIHRNHELYKITAEEWTQRYARND